MFNVRYKTSKTVTKGIFSCFQKIKVELRSTIFSNSHSFYGMSEMGPAPNTCDGAPSAFFTLAGPRHEQTTSVSAVASRAPTKKERGEKKSKKKSPPSPFVLQDFPSLAPPTPPPPPNPPVYSSIHHLPTYSIPSSSSPHQRSPLP